MLFTALIAALAGWSGPAHTVRPAAEVVEVRPQMLPTGERRDQTRFALDDERARVVGQVSSDGSVEWASSERARRMRALHPDAPAMIYVQAFDAVFSIDPFEALPVTGPFPSIDSPVTPVVARMLLGQSGNYCSDSGTSLETNRALFSRRGIDRAEELFRSLEHARVSWLRDHGYLNARTVRAGVSRSAVRAEPTPAGRFRAPTDQPRTRAVESVRADDRPSPESLIASADAQPVRVSLPPGMSAQAAERIEQAAAPAQPQPEPADDATDTVARLD